MCKGKYPQRMSVHNIENLTFLSNHDLFVIHTYFSLKVGFKKAIKTNKIKHMIKWKILPVGQIANGVYLGKYLGIIRDSVSS